VLSFAALLLLLVQPELANRLLAALPHQQSCSGKCLATGALADSDCVAFRFWLVCFAYLLGIPFNCTE